MSAPTAPTRTRQSNPRETPTSAPIAGSQTHRPYRIKLGYWWWSLPAVLMAGGVIYATTVSGAFFAFTDWTGIGDFNFIGFQNFVEILQTPELVGALFNTVLLAVGFVIFANILGLLFALALNRTLKSRYLLRVLLFMPVVVSPVAVSYVWKFIFSWDGALNQMLRTGGLTSLQQDWLANPDFAIWCILLVMVWQNIGFCMVIYLAGLATVPVELEEAAALDGAGAFRRFRYVTLPLIQPAVLVAGALMLIQGLRVFDQVMALTGGGPAGATQTLATEVYLQTFTYAEFGFGAALALLLSVLIFVFAGIQFLVTRRLAGKES